MKITKKYTFAAMLVLSVSGLVSFTAGSEVGDVYLSAISHPDRFEGDSRHDEKRLPQAILPFTQINSGDLVLELGAGGGYTTELLSWTVGKSGKVYAHFLYNDERLKDNRLNNVVPLREHSLTAHQTVLAELQIEDNALDAIVIFFVLHDIYLNNEMSEDLLQALYKALKPGGKLVILDNAAKPESGLAHIGDLHRIGERFVKSEMSAAGFVFDASTDVLRNKSDDHTRPWGDFRGYQDRFAFRFIKPAKRRM